MKKNNLWLKIKKPKNIKITAFIVIVIILSVFSFFSVYKWFKSFQKTTPVLNSVPEKTSQTINNNNISQDDKQIYVDTAPLQKEYNLGKSTITSLNWSPKMTPSTENTSKSPPTPPIVPSTTSTTVTSSSTNRQKPRQLPQHFPTLTPDPISPIGSFLSP